MSGHLRTLAAYAVDWRSLVPRLTRIARRFLARSRYQEALAGGELIVAPAGAPTDRLLSVVMPVYRVTEQDLCAAIDSVHKQSHRNWELLLLDDASPDPHVGRVLGEACRTDARIRARRRTATGGIAVASNELIAEARGEFVAFLDHDDLIHPRALELVDRFLAARGDVDWVYTDEDKLDDRGRHVQPCFKPGFSHQLLLGFNYVTHFRVVRRTLLDRLGGHRTTLDGAQDYDLALRAVAAGARLDHLPGVLYHWRTASTSMARSAAAKPAALACAIRALTEHAAAFPDGGEISASVLFPRAPFFSLRRRCRTEQPLAVADTAGVGAPCAAGLGRQVRVLPCSDGEDVARLAARCRDAGIPYLLVPPPSGLQSGEVEELLALLQVPGTALAAGRAVHGRRVDSSGWLATNRGLWDPCAGLLRHDPGYLNLAAVPAPRSVPPPCGWAARTEALVAALAAAAEIPAPWRLSVGLHRIGVEAVTTPTVSFPAPTEPPAAPSGPVPIELPVIDVEWLRHAGVRPERGRK